ncbi:hypothetical protein E1301_Tti023692 [Triplophysa tibetana]|uniref:Uncharacterized protein n=1 Tax=Triplophysa tibetana TaxID=1572043 RepID=A0A5A9NI55_9TELE|nr:hypothetical protein E1301_Tti023692 [Triplophysa tibetana]
MTFAETVPPPGRISSRRHCASRLEFGEVARLALVQSTLVLYLRYHTLTIWSVTKFPGHKDNMLVRFREFVSVRSPVPGEEPLHGTWLGFFSFESTRLEWKAAMTSATGQQDPGPGTGSDSQEVRKPLVQTKAFRSAADPVRTSASVWHVASSRIPPRSGSPHQRCTLHSFKCRPPEIWKSDSDAVRIWSEELRILSVWFSLSETNQITVPCQSESLPTNGHAE